MAQVTRRDFLKAGAKLAALMGLSQTLAPQVAKALEELASGLQPVVWLQGQSCSGCSVSLLNVDMPSIAEVLTGYLSLLFHSSLSVATGEVGMKVMHDTIKQGGYLLVCEGSVPASMPLACKVGGELYTEQLLKAAQNAKAVVAAGACAAFGGIPAAENNLTGATSVSSFLTQSGVRTSVINVPGCPIHPDWMIGTIVHVLKFGMPALDAKGRPIMFYGRPLHEQCPRFADYERENFAGKFGEPGCLFKLGCAGPITHADCSVRLWNSRTNFCINAGAPCIGCASSQFARSSNFSLYTKDRAEEYLKRKGEEEG